MASGILVGGLAACGSAEREGRSNEQVLASLVESAGAVRTRGADLWEVAVCRIPENFDESLYDMSGIRLDWSADRIASELRPVSEYFERWSSGRYSVDFVPAARDVRPAVGGAQECVEVALDQSQPRVDGVIVVADAQHFETRNGGWGRTGGHCALVCTPAASKRAIYLGAADFVGESPPALDLVEHELGHALGWPHSRRTVDYDSGLDVMSDSAAGRRADSARVHAPGVLAVNRYVARWSKVEPIVLEEGDAAEIDAERFAVFAVSDTSVLTIELIVNGGDYAHLESPGVSVHLVDWGPDACSDPTSVSDSESSSCSGTSRSHRSIAPSSSLDGLMRAGDEIEVASVTIVVESIAQRSGGTEAVVGVKGA